MNIRNTFFMLCCSFLSILLLSCDDDDEQVQALSVNFSTTEVGFSGEDSEKTVEIVFSRATEQSGVLNLSIDTGSLAYGEENDFYTEPAAEGNSMQVPFESGVNQVSFHVHKGAGLNIDADASISFTLQSDAEDFFQLGVNSELTAQFSENFISPSGNVTLDAGGPEFTVVAFFDISKNKQTRINKYSWDLGFYNGSENRVTVNNTSNVMARPLDKTDMASVTAEDTVGFGGAMLVPNFSSPDAAKWIDHHNGDLSLTAFGDIATSSEEAKVFIIKRDGGVRDWKKVKMYTTASGYTIEYASISDESFETEEISKEQAFNFNYFDLDNGAVNVEPAKDSWDFMYSTYVNRYPLGAGFAPYEFKDFITINRNSTEVAMVMKEDSNFEDLILSNAETLEYATNIDAIGSSWRSSGGPSGGPELFTDRFYVLKDSQDNYYKLEFLDMTATDAKERGYLNLKFELLD